MTTLNIGQKDFLTLPPQSILTATAPGTGTLRVTRLSDDSGGAPLGSDLLADAAAQVYGPYSHNSRFRFDCLSGEGATFTFVMVTPLESYIRSVALVPTGAPAAGQYPIVVCTHVTLGGIYAWTGAAWVRSTTTLP